MIPWGVRRKAELSLSLCKISPKTHFISPSFAPFFFSECRAHQRSLVLAYRELKSSDLSLNSAFPGWSQTSSSLGLLQTIAELT